jgi:hypothetical protein
MLCILWKLKDHYSIHKSCCLSLSNKRSESSPIFLNLLNINKCCPKAKWPSIWTYTLKFQRKLRRKLRAFLIPVNFETLLIRLGGQRDKAQCHQTEGNRLERCFLFLLVSERKLAFTASISNCIVLQPPTQTFRSCSIPWITGHLVHHGSHQCWQFVMTVWISIGLLWVVTACTVLFADRCTASLVENQYSTGHSLMSWNGWLWRS